MTNPLLEQALPLARSRWWQLGCSPWWLVVGVSLLWTLLFNQPFLQAAAQVMPAQPLFMVNLGLLLTVLQAWLLTLLCWPRLFKPGLMLLWMMAAGASYFIHSYGIVIDRGMLQNALATDSREVQGLLTSKMLWWMLGLGLLPALGLGLLPLRFAPWPRHLRVWLSLVVGWLLLLVLLLLMANQHYASFLRNHKEVRQLATPVNVVYAAYSLARQHWQGQGLPYRQLGLDARQSLPLAKRSKPSLLVLVVGETARADHFSLNGYPRQTNPQLAQLPLLSFSQVSSCGTATAVSVPCMFSLQNRQEYDEPRAQRQDNLLDILQRAGLEVWWLDNNSGCKGVCERIRSIPLPEQRCEGECRDELMTAVLLEQLQQAPQRDRVVVLHQLGSHGPDYSKRYPAQAAHFSPACQTSQLQECSQEEVINAYDNTLVYSDQVLAQLIRALQQQGDYDSALLYVSDHGESLGENGLYLHGMPYLLAPEAQKHVPMLLWLSPGYQRSYGLDQVCLQQQRQQPWSHDNLVHSVLGMSRVETSVYQPQWDWNRPCYR